MLAAGDEFGRTQQGNNNAYAQDNAISWVDWAGRDRRAGGFRRAIERSAHGRHRLFHLLSEPGEWTRLDGAPMSVADWESPETQGLCYEARLDDGRLFRLRVDRNARSVLVDIVHD